MLTFPKTRISRVFVSPLRLPAVKSPQTENTRSTYACDAGAEMMSSASCDSNGKAGAFYCWCQSFSLPCPAPSLFLDAS